MDRVPNFADSQRVYPRRVVQWATGNIGTRSLRTVIEHPYLELVGVFVHSTTKAGRDAGELCGLPPVGVQATRQLEAILETRPDCVLYMQQGVDVDALCKLLESGCNVVTTCTNFHNPAFMETGLRQRIEQACQQGGASLHSTGSSPGFITEALPLVLMSLQRKLNCVHIHEYADVSSRDSPQLLFDIMGFNQDPRQVNAEGRVQHLRQSFGPSLALLANALGIPLDGLQAHGEVALARSDVAIAAGRVEAGKVAAQRTTVAGIRDGKPVCTFTANWFVSRDLQEAWQLNATGWKVRVDGDVPLEVDIGFPVPQERWAAVSPGITAHRAVNAVPYVCDAPAGIRTSVELPQIIADLRT